MTNLEPKIEAGNKEVDAVSHITGLTDPTFKGFGNPDGDVTMRDNPTNISQDAITHGAIEERARADERRQVAAESLRAHNAAKQAAVSLQQQQYILQQQQIG